MKKKIRFTFIMVMAAFFLSGCQSDDDRAETEALRQQVDDLQRQISELQQGTSSNDISSTESAGQTSQNVDNAQAEQNAQNADNPQTGQNTQNTDNAQTGQNAQNADNPLAETGESLSTETSDTMADLTGMVDAFVQKAGQISLSSTGDVFDQFLSLKKESNQIETQIDAYEDTLEKQYRDGTLSRDKYRELEQELEALEDSLDNAEDTLETIFGIDD